MTKSKKPTLDDVSKATVSGLRKGQKSDSEVMEEKNATGETRVSLRKVGQNQSVNDKVSSFNEFDEENILEKRTYRKSGSDDLSDPEQSPRAEANRLTVKLTPRVSLEHKALFDEIAENFQSRRGALEHAIEALGVEYGLTLEAESPEEPDLDGMDGP